MSKLFTIVIAIISALLAVIAFAHLAWFLLYMDGHGEFNAVNIIIDIGLLALFGIQHSLMASNYFKYRILKVIPTHLERSTYIIVSSLFLLMVIIFWRPLPVVIFELTHLFFYIGLALYISGWLLSLYSLL